MVGYTPDEAELSRGVLLTAGALSGVLTRTCTQPIDVLKIRFQLQVEPISSKFPTSKYQGGLHGIRTIIKEESWTAFWKGHLASQCLAAVFMAAEIITKYLYINYSGDRYKSMQHFIGGAGAGGVAVVVSYPFDIVRTRFVAQGKVKVYTGLYQAFSHIYRIDGISGYYKGLFAAICHTTPQSALYFGLYHLFKQTSVYLKSDKYQDLITAASGASAGVASKLIAYPFDISKRRLQIIGFEQVRKDFGVTRYYNGVINHIVTSLKEEGVRGLYKGATWAFIKSGVSTSLYFFIYEKFCTIMRQSGTSSDDC